MGDYNPNSPTLVGSEWSPTASRGIDLAPGYQGIAMRINPGAITPTNAYLFQKAALNSLLGLEVTDELAPDDIFAENIFPGTSTGKVASGVWVDETGSANGFAKVAKNNDDTTFLAMTGGTPTGVGTNALALGAVSAPSLGGATPLTFRGGRSATYASSSLRVASVTINARVWTTRSTMRFQFGLEAFGGSTKFIVLGGDVNPVADARWHTYSLTLPGDPWLMAELNSGNAYYSAPHATKSWDDRVTTSGPYGFGILPRDTKGGGGGNVSFRVSGMWLNVVYCTENRRYCSYPRTLQAAGWNGGAVLPLVSPTQRLITFTSNSGNTALTTPTTTGTTNKAGDFTANDVGAKIVRVSDGQVVGTILSVTNSTTAVLTANGASTNAAVDGYLGTPPTALSASTYYYAVLSSASFLANATSQMDVLQDPLFLTATDPAATGNHRTCYNLAFTSPGSFVPNIAFQTVGEMLPLILTTGGLTTQAGESQAAARLFTPASSATSTARVYNGNGNAQQVTSAAATLYGAVRVCVTRANLNLDPDQPLTVEIRHGAGSLTGGGTLDASATIYPNQLTGNQYKPTTITAQFAAAFTSTLATQYVVYFRSTAKSTRAWAPVLLDSRSDALNGAVTTAIVEGAGVGGTTDAWANNGGSPNTRYDAAVALCAAPAAPAGLAATSEVAS